MQQHEIKAKREAINMSQQELGEAIGLSGQTARTLISAYENNSGRDKPSGARLDLIGKALAVGAKLFVEREKKWADFRKKNVTV